MPTGVALALPPGHAGLVLARSGLAARHGVTCLNAPGLIDAGYRGEIAVILCNTDPTRRYEVHRGDRIAQLVVVPRRAGPVRARRGAGADRARQRWIRPLGPMRAMMGRRAARREGAMQRLSGLDAMFFYLETPSNHMHVTGVFVLDPSDAPDGFCFDHVRSMVAGRLHRAAPFRRRLVEVPFRLAHPVWVEDPNFDLDYHVRRASLPSPGGPAELEAFVAQVVGLPLDRDRPLWEMYVVEGLEGGRQALVMKMHHAAIDGVSGAELTAAWLDLEPSPPEDPDDVDTWEPERLPNEVDLLVDALTQLVGNPLKAMKMARRLMESALHVTEHNRVSAVHPPPSPFERAADPLQPVDHPAPPRRLRLGPPRGPKGGEGPLRLLGQRRRARLLRGCTPPLPRRGGRAPADAARRLRPDVGPHRGREGHRGQPGVRHVDRARHRRRRRRGSGSPPSSNRCPRRSGRNP